MNKINCDVCGTAYPETATQCPICGNAKSNNSRPNNTAGVPGDDGYAYVKGGRFSHSNVRKINEGSEVSRQNAHVSREESYTPPPRRRRPDEETRKKERNTNIVLWAIIVILILAIIAVCCFIAVRLINMYKQSDQPQGNNETTTSIVGTGTTSPTTPTESVPVEIPCVGVRVSMPSHTFTAVGAKLLLGVTTQPENTTDPIIFTSSDPRIATVDEDGEIVAVANGVAIITVTCGEFSAQCEIHCNVGVDPVEEIPCTGVVVGMSTYTFSAVGDNIKLGITLQPANTTDSVYFTSSNPSIATVNAEGLIVAVSKGTAVITVTCGEFSAQCEIICDFENVTTNPTDPSDPSDPSTSNPPVGEAKEYGYFYKEGYLNVRAGAGSTYGVVAKLYPNLWVEILEKVEVNGKVWGRIPMGWVQITGYIKLETSTTELTSDTKFIGTVNPVNQSYSSVNVRSDAGTSFSAVGKVKRGEVIEILEFKIVDGKVWGRIENGWVLITDMIDVVVVSAEEADHMLNPTPSEE